MQKNARGREGRRKAGKGEAGGGEAVPCPPRHHQGTGPKLLFQNTLELSGLRNGWRFACNLHAICILFVKCQNVLKMLAPSPNPSGDAGRLPLPPPGPSQGGPCSSGVLGQ
jgi:hypothetical protein